MTDAEYIFRQTSKERKRNGTGDFHKKRKGGRVIHFPSDHLSRKEKKALNGEVKTYSFRDPLTWEQFKEMPKDIRQQYLDTLTDKFHGVLLSMIAESMGVKRVTLGTHMNRHGIHFNSKADSGAMRSARKRFLESEDGKAWVKWHEDSNRRKTLDGNATIEENAAIEAENYEVEPIDADDETSVSDVDKLANLIASLKGTGAKVTIEITL